LLRVVARTLAAYLDDPLHVAALGPNQTPCHLEVLFIIDLDVKPAGVLDVVIVSTIAADAVCPCT
jgi:hypothetical protein